MPKGYFWTTAILYEGWQSEANPKVRYFGWGGISTAHPSKVDEIYRIEE